MLGTNGSEAIYRQVRYHHQALLMDSRRG